jgi:hypothetical protein
MNQPIQIKELKKAKRCECQCFWMVKCRVIMKNEGDIYNLYLSHHCLN